MIKTIFLTRHGLRLDGEDETYFKHYAKRPIDTPLSNGGIIQAEDNGEFLQYQQVDHIFCSPFFRTVQTASIIGQKLNLQINVENGFIEQLVSKWFTSFPDIVTKEEAAHIFPNINQAYESLVRPIYPEDDANIVFTRVKRAIEEVSKRYEGNILIVGHGASVHATKKVLDASLEGFNGNMGALTKFVQVDGRWKCEFSTTDHLSVVSVGGDPEIHNNIPAQFRKKNQVFKEQFPLEKKKAKEYAEGIQ